MLTYLHIQNFTIIDELELDFANGMTVITGETGAGKSIILDALSLVLGGRAEQQFIRHGTERCEIHAAFDLKNSPVTNKWLQDNELSNDECLIRRIMTRDGRSKIFVNGQPQTQQKVRELGDTLVQIHGQHQHQQLLHRDAMRAMLDSFGELNEWVQKVNTHYTAWRDASNQLKALSANHESFAARLALLRYQAQELEELGLAEDELEQLHQEHKQLSNAEQLQHYGNQLINLLSDDEKTNINNGLQQALHLVKTIQSESGNALAATFESLQQAQILLAESIDDVRSFVSNTVYDPERLKTIEQRLQNIHDMARKHHVPAEQLALHLQQLSNELSDLENSDETIAKLQQTIASEEANYFKVAKQLTNKRRKVAEKLNKAMTASIQELGMPQGHFAVELEPIKEQQPAANGCERVVFCVAANPGQPLQAINKVASGGELSRISLALQVLTAGKQGTGTMIFDEVDVGIGGETAHIVGQHLRALTSRSQVMCVTHLPQVAACGHHHLRVTKQVENQQTFTVVTPLKATERTHEIARMLGGKSESKQSLAHAEEMLALVS